MIEKKLEILKNKKINHFQQSELFNDLETGHHQNQACEQYLEKQILNPKILTDKSMTTENNQDQSKIIIKEMIEDNEIKKIDPPQDQFNQQNKSRDSHEPNYKLAKEKAFELIERFGFDNPPIDPIQIARELGINVRLVSFPEENRKISGFFYAKRNEIFVNEDDDIYRQIFTIAHELGHKILHDQWLKTSQYQVLWRDASMIDAGDSKEKEANCFAGNLLVPKYLLKQYYQIANVEELSALFGVSRQVISYRLKHEGFVTKRYHD